MAFLTGIMLLNAPAGALNNAGADKSSDNENAVAVKAVRSKEGSFPYISAQAIRFWLRNTLDREKPNGWQTAPIDREGKIAYTDGNPIRYWDDDLFGYMRAPGKSADAEKSRKALVNSVLTPTSTTITRVSPLRVSTFLSLGPTAVTSDFGTMSRHEGNPVPHEHQFYHTVLKGMFSLDLHAAGTFSYANRTGYLNLDDIRIKEAQAAGLTEIIAEKSFRLPDEERRLRVASLLEGLSIMSGGAKQALHYTDVTPAIVLAMVTRGGNNPLQYVIGPDKNGLPALHLGALNQMVEAWGDQIESPLYVGWVEGFCDDQRKILEDVLANQAESPTAHIPPLPKSYLMGHPRLILQQIAEDFKDATNAAWLA
jgi:CRISPR-associated protein Cst2